MHSALRKAKNLPEAGAVNAEAHAQARARLLSALPDATFESAPKSTTFTIDFFQSFIYKPVAATAASVVFVAGGWLTTSAAQNSLPGDTLYNVKIISERAQLRVASLDKRAVLHTEFAGRRLEEVAALQRVAPEQPARAQYIPETVNAYQREIASATTDLQALQEQSQPEALATATTVLDQVALLSRNAEEISEGVIGSDEVLPEAVVAINTDTVANQVNETTQAIADVATGVTLDVHEKAPSMESSLEVKKMFRAMYGDIEARRALLMHRIATIQETAQKQKNVLAQGGVVLPQRGAFTEMEKRIAEIGKELPVIMDSFAAGGVRSSLDALKEIEGMLQGMENELTQIEESIIQTVMKAQEEEVQKNEVYDDVQE